MFFIFKRGVDEMESNFNKQVKNRYLDGSVIAVGCNQVGDSGKGAIVDALMYIAWLCVRCGGADNCGHTTWANGLKYVSHMIPSGIIHDARGVVSIIARGVALNPLTARQELIRFLEMGITHDNLKISFRAKLILPYHILFDMLSESMSSESKKIGTTGRGVGPVFADYTARTSLFVGDMLDENVMYQKLKHVLRDKIAFLKTCDSDMLQRIMQHERLENGLFFHPKSIVDIDAIVERYRNHGEYFRAMICDTEAYIKSQLGKKTIVLEGAQGVVLDIDHGSYPFVTSSRATIAGMANGAGLREDQVTEKLGVVKAYMTRVGEGAFPTEIGGYNAVSMYKDKFQKGLEGVSLSEQINDSHAIIQGGAIGLKGHEFGATTGRLRRIGWMDLMELKHAIDINGPKIVVTKLDVLSGIKTLPICVGYRYEGNGNPAIPVIYGQELEYMIPENDILKDCYPIYEYLDGWNEDISDVRAWEDLPINAQKYLQFIIRAVGAKIVMIRVGPKREQVFFV